jgi:hypothetical protein
MPIGEHKARKILRDRSVRGNPLTGKQKRFFGFIAGGGNPTRRIMKQRAKKA